MQQLNMKGNDGNVNGSSNGNGNSNGNGDGKIELRSDALQSWKEIAAYLKRGVRTAQRWERCAGLPVRRPRAGDRSPVFAFHLRSMSGCTRAQPVPLTDQSS